MICTRVAAVLADDRLVAAHEVDSGDEGRVRDVGSTLALRMLPAFINELDAVAVRVKYIGRVVAWVVV